MMDGEKDYGKWKSFPLATIKQIWRMDLYGTFT